ncbi:MAG: family 20 glycosylhydrolase [Ignavibacteriaceae bacterium]|nr:family 20 glycosylhydrolase [Ignavibacteriaceae bacterium]
MKYLILLMTTIFTLNIQGQQMEKDKLLMPVPKEVSFTGEKFRLDPSFMMRTAGKSSRLNSYATRIYRSLSDRTGLFFLQDNVSDSDTLTNAKMTIRFDRTGELKVNENEAYELKAGKEGVTLTAKTDIGAMRGLETFLQLVSADKDGYYIPGVMIKDEPRFTWRGLMLDVCRHWMPLDVVIRNIDAMAMMKMNVLHLHLSEDQGFRVESKVYPKLHEMGSDGNYFTQDQIKYIVKYAAERGIRVYPEFDVPGHSVAWLVGYPELGSRPGPYKIERRWGIRDEALDPTKEFTYEFLGNLFKEMAALFPDDYFHIGGDEVTGKDWDKNPDIQKFMKEKGIKDNHELQAHFNLRILDILTKLNKKMVGWDEIFQPVMPKDIVIHSWRGIKSLVEASQKGYYCILSNGYYIDLIQPASFHYLNDPIPADTKLTPAEQKYILGGEATMWSELVTPENVDSRIWPRTAAIAERLWSPGSVKDVDDMYRRLEYISFRLEERGVKHIKNYEMMLRRLAGGRDIAPVKMLVDLLEPMKIYTRHRDGVTYLSISPYTRAADAARPDQKIPREFMKAVEKYKSDGNFTHLEPWMAMFELWGDNHAAFTDLAEVSPVLREVVPHSENLKKISEMMLEYLGLLQNNGKPSKELLENLKKTCESAKKTYGQAELMIVPAVLKLIE